MLLFRYQSEISVISLVSTLVVCSVPLLFLDARAAVALILLLLHVLSGICIHQVHVTLLPVVPVRSRVSFLPFVFSLCSFCHFGVDMQLSSDKGDDRNAGESAGVK